MRAPFPKDLKRIRGVLSELVKEIDSATGGYGSAYLERKTTRGLSVDLKKSNATEDAIFGVVFRAYNGYSLFEQASDDVEPEALRRTVQRLIERVKKSRGVGALKPYSPPTWDQRLAVTLEDDIRSQVPKGVRAETQVHFGIRFKEDPVAPTSEALFERLRATQARVLAAAPSSGLAASDITFLALRLNLSTEEAIFVDRESDLSQTLYRTALMLVLMNGANRTFLRIGGLGGLEAADLSDKQIRSLLSDLKALTAAERLEPGKYRVLCSPAVTGVLAHEAFGHSQEGDTCARGRSKAWDLHHTGEKVGNEHATILNNPAIFKNGGHEFAAWGSYYFDEEGWLSTEQVILDRGTLLPPMTNLTSALRLEVPRTANGKRENWSHGVYTRQTNTYFSAGRDTLPDLMKQLGDGFVADHCAGGMEDPKGMGIQVGMAYLKEVKSGKLTGRVFRGPAGGDVQMTGYVPDVLNSIVAKSRIDAENQGWDNARYPENDVGGCGKYHKELVYAGCGGPWMLLNDVILG